MAPKAKVRAGGGGLRRPAAPPPMRARGGEGGGARPRRRVDPEGVDSWLEGRELPLHQVRLEHLQVGQILEITEAIYYGEKTKVCGKLQRVEMDGPHFHLVMELLGTTSEEILRVHSLDSREYFHVHRCPADCNQETTGDRYIHGLKGRLVKDLSKEGWMRNLEKAVGDQGRGDDLPELRQMDRELRQTPGPKEVQKKDEDSSSRDSKDRKKKKDRKDKKERKKKEKKVRKEKRKREDSGSGDSSMEKLNGRRPLLASVKKFKALFAGTGLDGRERVRRRVNHRARKFLKKGKKDKSSSSQSPTSSESSSHQEEDLRDGGLHGDLQGEGSSRAIPGSTCPRSPSSYGGPASTREGGELGGCQRQTNSFPLLQTTVGQAAEWPCLTGGGHLGHVDGLLDEGPSIPRDGCPCSEAEVHRGVSLRIALASMPEDGTRSSRADADSKACGDERSPKGDLRRGEDAVALNPSPRRKGEREGPGWKVQPERRWKKRWQGRQRWRQAEGRQEREVRSYEEREDSWAPTGELLSSRYDGTSMSAAGKGGVDVEELGSRPEMVDDPDCVTLDRPPVTSSGAGFSLQDGNCGIPPHSGKKDDGFEDSFEGQRAVVFKSLGSQVLQRFLEALPLRSKPTGSGQSDSLFPIPTSRNVLQSRYPDLDQEEISWFSCVCLGLNSLWGGDLFNEDPPSSAQAGCLDVLVEDISRLKSLTGEVGGFDWGSFFRTRTIDYQGDEIKVALWFRWSNISPALPREIGVIPLEEVCQHRALYYVKNIDLFLKDKAEWPTIKPPKVMVHDEDWPAVCSGLCQAGVCTVLRREEVFDTGDGPLLNGLFGVSKEEVFL